MPSFQQIRPWVLAIGHFLVLAGVMANPVLILYEAPASMALAIAYTIAVPLLWIVLVVLSTNSAPEKADFFVRRGGMLWLLALLIAMPAGFLFKPWYSEDEPVNQALWWGVLFVVMHLVLISAIHIARFQVPQIRDRGQGKELVIRPREGGRVALAVRIAGMVFLAAAAVDVLWMPIVVIPDPSNSEYLLSYIAAAGFAVIGAGLLFASRFVADIGDSKTKVVVER